MSGGPKPIVTRVARCGVRDSRFFGWSVFDDLLGKESFLGLLALGLTGRRFSDAEVALLDDLAVVLTAADPRIWVLKAARLLASLGDPLAGALGGQLCLVGARVGGAPVVAAGHLLVELKSVVNSAFPAQENVAHVVAAINGREWIAGFGVPYREHDQRVDALARRARDLGRDTGHHFRLVAPLVEAVRTIKPGLSPNASLPIAALCLDLGFEPRHMGSLVAAMLFLPTIANTFEESELMSPSLRELPGESVDYAGPPPRRSPRARTAPPSGAEG